MHLRKPLTAVLLTVFAAAAATAQHSSPSSEAPNPYAQGQRWGTLPDGRTWGSTSAIYPHRDSNGDFTGNIWVFERCAKSSCIGSDLDPILLFDSDGKLIRGFGAGLFVWPHGIYADHQGNLWVADAVHTDCKPGVAGGKGHQVHKFSPDGKLLMSLGVKGFEGGGENAFSCPSDVVVSSNGDIFVTDGHNHGHGGSNRLVKFNADGKFVAAWGKKGTGPGEFQGLHALAIDSQGRLFVGDRANQRIQILDQDGNHIDSWKQFGSPSGIFIDEDDTLYVADSDSGFDPDGSGKPRNPGVKRGIYIGSARSGKVSAFIPDPSPDLSRVTSGAEGVAVSGGAVFGAQVGGSRGILKYAEKN